MAQRFLILTVGSCDPQISVGRLRNREIEMNGSGATRLADLVSGVYPLWPGACSCVRISRLHFYMLPLILLFRFFEFFEFEFPSNLFATRCLGLFYYSFSIEVLSRKEAVVDQTSFIER